MQKTKTGKQQFRSGIIKFAWAELKTMNLTKIKGLYLIGLGYIKMKYFTPHPPKRIEQQPRIAH